MAWTYSYPPDVPFHIFQDADLNARNNQTALHIDLGCNSSLLINNNGFNALHQAALRENPSKFS